MFTRIVCAMSCMLVLLLSPAAALNGAAYGLALWYRTLFPTLMPFMVLSNFIVYTGCAKPIGVLLASACRFRVLHSYRICVRLSNGSLCMRLP